MEKTLTGLVASSLILAGGCVATINPAYPTSSVTVYEVPRSEVHIIQRTYYPIPSSPVVIIEPRRVYNYPVHVIHSSHPYTKNHLELEPRVKHFQEKERFPEPKQRR